MTNLNYPNILECFPLANFSLPPLSNPAWADAIEETIKERAAGEVCRFVAGFPIHVDKYFELTSPDREVLSSSIEKEPRALARIVESFVHANYETVSRTYTGLLVLEGELTAASPSHATSAEAKKVYQAYLGLYKAGKISKERIVKLLQEREMSKVNNEEI